MSNGTAYLDVKGFATAMTKCNIHFEAPDVAIPLIFDQLVGTHQSTASAHSQTLFLAADAFVGWMMGHVRVHLHCATAQRVSRVPFDRRIDSLFAVLRAIEQEEEQNRRNTNSVLAKSTRKRGRKSKVLNPFEVQSLYASSGSGTTGGGAHNSGGGAHNAPPQPEVDTSLHFNSFKALTTASGLPPRQKQYHPHGALSLRTPSTVKNVTRTTSASKSSKRKNASANVQTQSLQSMRSNGHSHRSHGAYTVHNKVPHRPYKKRSQQEVKSGHFSKY